jgi:CBS domain-containing protein
MIAQELINQKIPPLKLTDTTQKAVRWMEEFKVSQLPVVEDGKFLGMLSEELVYDLDSYFGNVEQARLIHQTVHVSKTQHFYDVLRIAAQHSASMVPVLDESEKYVGVINLGDPATILSKLTGSHNPGGIIEISMSEKDYSLAEIARLIESNDTKILSAFIHSDEVNKENLRLTLKLNKIDLGRTIATLERFGYQISAQWHETDLADTDQERLGMLLKYLNI